MLKHSIPRTLHNWLERFSQPRWRGCHLEGWLFEGPAARRAAEQQLARAGVHAKLRSAYKPLLHYFLEEIDTAQLQGIRIHYPSANIGESQRFLLEAWPLAALPLPEAPQFCPRTDNQPWYDLELHWKQGLVTAAAVFAPNRTHADVLGMPTLSATGWLHVGSVEGASDLLDTPVHTDVEQAFEEVVRTVKQHPWPDREPYFERLHIRLDIPQLESAIGWMNESISLPEALHEDLYFSLLEWFQQHSGRPPGDRRLQPGQIVPDIRCLPEAVSSLPLHIQQHSFADTRAAEDAAALAWHAATDSHPLDNLDTAPPPGRIRQHLDAWGGQAFAAKTRQGRPVWGRYWPGQDVAVFLSAGQHANETSGIVGALRATQTLLTHKNTHLALIALENPDGYALHHALCQHNPQHMQHAARYTALGDDVEYRNSPPWFERTARHTALALSGAQLHINLHGYPAHEWTRPFSGYVPRHFAQWMLPKGHFLILRYHPGWQRKAHALLETVCTQLQQVPGLAEYNTRQQRLYEGHAGPLPFEIVHGIACLPSENPDGDTPVTLITEFPDETLHGEAFCFAHTVQMHTVLAAYHAWQRISADIL